MLNAFVCRWLAAYKIKNRLIVLFVECSFLPCVFLVDLGIQPVFAECPINCTRQTRQ